MMRHDVPVSTSIDGVDTATAVGGTAILGTQGAAAVAAPSAVAPASAFLTRPCRASITWPCQMVSDRWDELGVKWLCHLKMVLGSIVSATVQAFRDLHPRANSPLQIIGSYPQAGATSEIHK